jgi:hypothetical protein
MFTDRPPVLFGSLTVQQRSRFGSSSEPQRALMPASNLMVTELQRAPDTTILRQLVQESYNWFANNNRAEADEYLRGACLAYQMNLPKQIRHYAHKMVEVYTKDMADRTVALFTGWPGTTTFQHYYFTSITPGRRFTVPIEQQSWGQAPMQWIVSPVEEFAQMIPVHAMEAFVAMEQAHIVPDAFWVADKVEVPRPRVSLDPILCCSFDRFLVGLVEWR